VFIVLALLKAVWCTHCQSCWRSRSTTGLPLTIALLLPEKRPREKIRCVYGQTALRTAHTESIFSL